MTNRLSKTEIESQLGVSSQWKISRDDQAIERSFSFESFTDAWKFLCKVVLIAEEQQHHPTILNTYTQVTLTLSTHDAGGVTDKDIAFAQLIDQIS